MGAVAVYLLAVSGSAKSAPVTKSLQGDEQILHAINRFIFGSRPSDMAAVNAMGLNPWFEQQANPASIDDSPLDMFLANFPVMKLSQQALMERYPPPQVLRMAEKQNSPLPTSPLERAIYRDQRT